jgi:4-amino-4-deoxy-L-arabinose transferase-like glycosyltransferase
MNQKLVYFLLAIICVLSFALTVYHRESSPVCFDADEAAFGYNAFSILKTGKDEYGTTLPLRLKSFGDYKMPLYSYLSVPFVKVMGLNEASSRSLNAVLALVFPIAVFFLLKELFNDKSVQLVGAALVASTLSLHLIARQAHEAYLATLLITLSTLFFIKILKKPRAFSLLFFFLSLGLSLFAYQSSRIFAVFYFLTLCVFAVKNRSHGKTVLLTAVVLAVLFIPDVIYQPARVGNLLFFKNKGLGMKTFELRSEGGSIYMYNKATVAVKDFINSHLTYYSPQFLTINGDENNRFGFMGMSPITAIEYVFFFVGLYYLFKKKNKWRYVLVALLLVAPLAGSLAWNGTSVSRTLFLFVLVLMMAAYGFLEMVRALPYKYVFVTSAFVVVLQLWLLVYSWNFYLFHYPQRAIVIRSFQCGYKELAQYMDKNESRFDHIYVTPKNGQPYIFQLFYSAYEPAKYQGKASLSAPDEYGFGQVHGFDNFVYEIPPTMPKKSVIVGYPDDFTSQTYLKSIPTDQIKTIQIGTEKIFKIYETK